jgi:hypothetical protein
MSNDITVKSGKILRVGEVDVEIVDLGIPVVVPNFFIENRQSNGVIALSFATAIADGVNQPEAHVCTRLRMDLVFAQQLRDALSDLIGEALAQPDKSKAN